MFDFEKLIVYNKAKAFNKTVYTLLSSNNYDRTTNDQLRRASFSIMLNIAEGTGRRTLLDKQRFYSMSRGSVYECVAIMDYLKDIEKLDQIEFDLFYTKLDELSRMLYAMIKYRD